MDALQIFEQDWPNDADVASLCAAVHIFLEHAGPQDHYTFAQIRSAVGAENDGKLAQALLYMSSPRLQLIKFIFFKPYGEEIVEIEPNDDGEFIDEDSGEELSSDDLMTGFERGTYYSQQKSVT
jgi:hypothetical protein